MTCMKRRRREGRKSEREKYRRKGEKKKEKRKGGKKNSSQSLETEEDSANAGACNNTHVSPSAILSGPKCSFVRPGTSCSRRIEMNGSRSPDQVSAQAGYDFPDPGPGASGPLGCFSVSGRMAAGAGREI
jgi:hypothetical protein